MIFNSFPVPKIPRGSRGIEFVQFRENSPPALERPAEFAPAPDLVPERGEQFANERPAAARIVGRTPPPAFSDDPGDPARPLGRPDYGYGRHRLRRLNRGSVRVPSAVYAENAGGGDERRRRQAEQEPGEAGDLRAGRSRREAVGADGEERQLEAERDEAENRQREGDRRAGAEEPEAARAAWLLVAAESAARVDAHT